MNRQRIENTVHRYAYNIHSNADVVHRNFTIRVHRGNMLRIAMIRSRTNVFHVAESSFQRSC